MAKEFQTPRKHVQVLSLAGGGFMGLFTADVLAEIEARERPLFETTELFAGTSVGALIALGLAAGTPANTIAEKMRANGADIFPPSAFPLISKLKAISNPKFNTEELRAVIESIVGKATLGDLERRVVVPAVDLTSGTCRIFRGGADTDDKDVPVADVALASAAAPIYFPVHTIGPELFADGGLVANAPDAIAAQEALISLGGQRGYVRMLAVGTTLYAAGSKSDAANVDWGAKDWLPQLLKFSMAGQVSLARQLAENMVGRENMLLVDPSRSSDQNDVIGLDKADEVATDTLAAIAKSAIRDLFKDGSSEKAFLQRWSNHTVPDVRQQPPTSPRIRTL